MRKLRILHITTRLVRGGGTENNIYYTIDQLKGEYDFILSTGADIHENPFEGDPSVKTIVCKDLINKIHPLKDLKALLFYYRLIRREKIDVIHTHEAKASLITRLSAWLAGCPYIIYGLHCVFFNDPMSKLKRKFYICLEKFTIGVSNYIVAVSYDVMKHYHANNIGKKIPYSVIRSGIDMKKFFVRTQVAPEDQKALRKKLGISPNTKVIINVGRFSFSKAQRYTIECFSRLKKDFPDSKLIFIGEGELLEECKQQAKESCIADNVLFEGYKKNVPLYLSISHLFLFTSLREGLPRVIVEAALMKVAVSAFEVEGIREVIEDKISGFIVKQYDVDGLYNGARTILANTELAHSFTERAFHHLEDEWDSVKMAEDLRKIYQDVEKQILK